MDIKVEESVIRNDWFKNHKAEYLEDENFKVLIWKEPGSSFYYIRYVFDGCKLYISGDCGEAIFCFTEKADLHIQTEYNLDYFYKKCKAFCESKYDFDSEIAIQRLSEEKQYYLENDGDCDIDIFNDLISKANDCCDIEDWRYAINKHYDELSGIDPDCCEWVFSCGNKTPIRIHGYLIGLKMAAEQLKSK